MSGLNEVASGTSWGTSANCRKLHSLSVCKFYSNRLWSVNTLRTVLQFMYNEVKRDSTDVTTIERKKSRKRKGLWIKDRCQLVSLISISSWWSSFLPAFSAVNRSASVRLEWYFTFLATIRADCLMHFSFRHSLFQLLMFCCVIAFYTLHLPLRRPL